MLFPHDIANETSLRVRYAETDRMGVVYYANYLVWMEVGRVDLCKALGFNYRDMEDQDGVFLAVAESCCRYRSPARFDDQVVVKTWVEAAHSRMVTFAYEMRLAEGGRPLASATRATSSWTAGWRAHACPKSTSPCSGSSGGTRCDMFRSPRPRYYTAAATALLAFLFLFTLYKAWTQSILLDEAFTYKTWVAAPFSSFYTVAGYNNHPLNTLLCRLAVWMFGLSEITLRLPAVLLGLVYLVATYRAARILFGPSFWMLLTVALNCANPLVLDHFATARGYGMGLAFWALGTCLALRCVSEPSGARRWFTAGAAFGLAAASYMTEVFAVTAIILVQRGLPAAGPSP